jgi:hypothetical protein
MVKRAVRLLSAKAASHEDANGFEHIRQAVSVRTFPFKNNRQVGHGKPSFHLFGLELVYWKASCNPRPHYHNYVEIRIF